MFLPIYFFRLFSFFSVESKHRNALFRCWSETMKTNILFWIVRCVIVCFLSRIQCFFLYVQRNFYLYCRISHWFTIHAVCICCKQLIPVRCTPGPTQANRVKFEKVKYVLAVGSLQRYIFSLPYDPSPCLAGSALAAKMWTNGDKTRTDGQQGVAPHTQHDNASVSQLFIMVKQKNLKSNPRFWQFFKYSTDAKNKLDI
jgi:hypothetical protein